MKILLCKMAVIATLALVSCQTYRMSSSKTELTKKLNQVLLTGSRQYKFLSEHLPDSLFPKTFEHEKLVFCKSGDWVSGFYPGTLLLIGNYSKDHTLYELAKQKLLVLQKEQFNSHTHDLGFMMYCSFGNALKYADSNLYRSILVNSAKSLSTRFNPTVGAIKSWDSKSKEDFLVIIDNMMNLELLFWATRYTGDSTYRNIAITHANTTLKNHFRPNGSSYHVVNYNPLTGAVKERKTHQGAFDESAWARGQAWGLYGYTMMYRETGDRRYLHTAENIMQFISKNLSNDYIPAWDFNAPDSTKHYKDASAAAIIASALFELCKYSPSNKKQYVQIAENILNSLSSEQYCSAYQQNGGFLLKHGVGHLPGHSEIDVPLSYADYYFVEAILRYLETKKNE